MTTDVKLQVEEISEESRIITGVDIAIDGTIFGPTITLPMFCGIVASIDAIRDGAQMTVQRDGKTWTCELPATEPPEARNIINEYLAEWYVRYYGKRMTSKYDGHDVHGQSFPAGTEIFYSNRRCVIA